MSRPLYGSALRSEKNKTNRLNTEARVLSAMPGMIADHVPALSTRPVNIEDFNTQIQSFQDFLRGEYPDFTGLQVAYEALARYVAEGNEHGLWQLDIPSIMVRISRTSSSRNHRHFKAGVNAGKLHQSWLHMLASEKHAPDQRARLADVLISAVFYGGLANPRAVTSLANLLVSDSKPLRVAYDNTAYAWIDLVLSGGEDPLNDRIPGESGVSWQTLQRFYPDNRTLGQLLKFQHIKTHKKLGKV